MSAPRLSRARGFTLIEVLVAFAIAALLLVPLLHLISLGIGTFGNAQNYATATLWAESALADAGMQEPIAEGTQSGDLPQHIHWEMSIERYHDDAMSDQPTTAPSGLVPYAITLTMSWPERLSRGSITFHTLRLGPPPQPELQL
jgi:general secretion pathway protein I